MRLLYFIIQNPGSCNGHEETFIKETGNRRKTPKNETEGRSYLFFLPEASDIMHY